MGLLLMQYEYQRAKQKVTLYELKSIRLNDMSERYQKRISNIQKLFSKKKSSLDSKYNQMQSKLQSQISYASASGNLGGISVGSVFTGLIGSAVMTGLDTSWGAALKQLGQADTNSIAAQQQLAAQRASLASQLQSVLQTIMEAMKEAELAELEAAEDRQREPIAQKDMDIQADIVENDTLLSLAQERMEAAKGRLPNIVKESVAHYGLS